MNQTNQPRNVTNDTVQKHISSQSRFKL